MPSIGRKVTFDPELRPSAQSSPPPLPLGHCPPIISLKDIPSLDDKQTCKSILKNGPQGASKPYFNLCNFFIDLPPPPSDNLLSLDILQQETVFKPKVHFMNLKEVETPVVHALDFESSSEEEYELEDEIAPTTTFIEDTQNIEDIINEDDLASLEAAFKPKIFESSLLMEQLSDDRIEYRDSIEKDGSELPRMEPSVDSVWVSYSGDEAIVPDSAPLTPEPSCEPVLHYEITVDKESWPGVDAGCEDLEDMSDGLDRRKDDITDIDVKTYIPEETADKKVDQVSPNIRKLDEYNNEFQDDFSIVNKRNKLAYNSPIEEPFSEQEIPSVNSLNITDIGSNELICEVISPEEERLIDEARSSKIDDLSSPSSTVFEYDADIDHKELDTETNAPQNTITNVIHSNTFPNYSHDSFLDNPSNIPTSDEAPITARPQNIRPITNASVEQINTDSTTNAETLEVKTPVRHRRKSGRKHRKHSHGSRGVSQAPATSSADNAVTASPSVDSNPDQRALDAQARFKRYLGKMSAKAKSENQNLNCAGEEETLEPHMRDSIKESQVLIWIYNMIDEAARVDFEFFLKDGCILCKLMNRIVPGCIPENEITWEGARSKQKNIGNFLREAEKYGVPKDKLFFMEDLLHLRHVPRVTRCIYALAKIAQSDPSLGPDMPQLGDEPSFLKAAPKVVNVPGHRDTKEVLAQLTASKEEAAAKKTKHSLYK